MGKKISTTKVALEVQRQREVFDVTCGELAEWRPVPCTERALWHIVQAGGKQWGVVRIAQFQIVVMAGTVLSNRLE